MRNRFYVWITPEGWDRIRDMFGRLAEGNLTFAQTNSTDKALTALSKKSADGEEIQITNAPPEVAEAIQELEDEGYIKIVPDLPDSDMWETTSISERLNLTDEEKLKLQRPMADNPEFAETFWLRVRADAGRN